MGVERLIFSKNICGFSRLKNIFRKGINYQSYENMIGTTSRPIMGNIPNDLLQLILKANPNTKKQAILKKLKLQMLMGVKKKQMQKIKKILRKK